MDLNLYSGLGMALAMAGIVLLVTGVVGACGVAIDRLAARTERAEDR